MARKTVLTVKGFDELLDRIKNAEGKIESAAEQALEAGARVLTTEFRAGAEQRNVPTNTLISPKVTWNGNQARVEAGFKLGEYNSRNPSSGYLALFKEYGAPSKGGNRKTAKGYNRGAVAADPFIRSAIQRNAKKVKQEEENALIKILRELEK